MAKLRMFAPENVSSASVEDVHYKVKDGKIKVHPEHAESLKIHGFIVEGFEEDEIQEDKKAKKSDKS